MIDFRPLDHETRTVALVGRFLQLWATLEYEVDRTIAKVLGITSAQHFVLAKNIPFFNKTHILRTLLEFLPIDDELEKFNDLLKDIQNYYGHRNMMAHDLFASSDSTDGVRFFVVRAKGKFAAPDINWGVDRFLEAFADISVYTAGLNVLRNKVGTIPSANSLAALIAAMPPSSPMEGLGRLRILDRHPPQSPTDHTSETTSASPETDSETPSSPER